jgi:poly(A) polymerase
VFGFAPLPPFLADPALRPVLDALPEARVVGGAVRDALIGRPVADVDLATPRSPQQVLAALQQSGLQGVPTGLAHGTVTAVSAGRGFEVTTLRRDVATDGRHATVAFTDDWRADAARRDFTINALSMTRDGAVFDFFGGIADLLAGRLRFVGDPRARIREDHLRVLRYFRFYARYTREPPDPPLRQALRDGSGSLAKLSVERIWSELARILAAPDPRAALALMAELGILAAILPEGARLGPLDRLAGAGAPADPILRLAAMLTGDPQSVAVRLRLSNADREGLAALAGAPLPQPGDDDDALRRLLADWPARTLIARTWLYSEPDARWSGLRARLAAMPPPVFPLAGRDVRALGVPAGPPVGRLLAELRAWWLAGGCRADAVACRGELARRLGAAGPT